MVTALAFLSVVIVLMSVFGVVQPQVLILFIRKLMADYDALWVAVGVRLVLAALLWFSSAVSHTPNVLKALAILALAAAVILLFVGADRVVRLLDWVGSWKTLAIRLWCLLGVVFGGFLFWSVSAIWVS